MKIREKKIKAIQNQSQIKTIKKQYTYNDKDIPLVSKQKEKFNKLVDESLDELNEKVNFDDLRYKYKGLTANANFNKFDNALSLLIMLLALR